MSFRNPQVAQLLHKEVAEILNRDFDFGDVLVTVLDVSVSPDSRHATVTFSALPEKEEKRVMDEINKEIFDLQQKINRRLRMRPVPKLRFVADKGFKKENEVLKVLYKLKKEQK